jgi:hypothetical protein
MSLRILAVLFFLLLVPNFAVYVQVSAQENLYFNDEFNANAINSTKWNTQIATNGSRWCPTTIENQFTAPGQWLNASSQQCNNVTQAAPYGNIIVENGVASFSSNSSYTFPYIWSGDTLLSSPFPSSEGFIFEIRMKYDEIPPFSGAGVLLLNSKDSNPIGDSPPINSTGIGIWADHLGLRVNWGSQIIPVISDPNNFHTYTLEYANGTYSLYLDGLLTKQTTTTTSAIRPNSIWIGNPVVTRSADDWSDFTIDYIHIGPNTTSISAVQSGTMNLSPPFFRGPA